MPVIRHVLTLVALLLPIAKLPARADDRIVLLWERKSWWHAAFPLSPDARENVGNP
jgi:hypothetical protein